MFSCSLMPSFQRSVLPLPFRRSVVPLCRCAQVTRTLIWLSTNGRTAKIGFNVTAVTAVTAQRQAGTATAQRNGGNQQRNFYVAYGILTEFVSTATAKRQGRTAERQNGTLETRHKTTKTALKLKSNDVTVATINCR